MEHAPPIQPEFSWRETAPKLALLITIALIGLGGWILVRPDGTRAAAPQIKQAPLRPRAATSVLVLNGNGTAGAAGGVATKLLADGYRSAPAMDAQLMTYARSVILYRRGWGGEAERLAEDSGIRAVAPLDGRRSRSPLIAIVGR